jgi:hypothetical protein
VSDNNRKNQKKKEQRKKKKNKKEIFQKIRDRNASEIKCPRDLDEMGILRGFRDLSLHNHNE